MMKRMMVLVAALLSPGALSAQQDLGGTYIDWGTVGVAVYPDTVLGMQLIMTARRFDIGSLSHDARGGYDPDSVFAWVNAAARMLQPATAPSGPDAILVSPVLRSSCGDSLRLFRRAKGTKWRQDVILSLTVARPREDHFGVQAKVSEVRALLDELVRQASLSAMHPETGVALQREPPPDSFPALLRGGAVFSSASWGGGVVVVEYRIDSTGHVDMDSIHPLFRSRPDLMDPTREWLHKILFTPAIRGGRPVPFTVRQVLNFGP